MTTPIEMTVFNANTLRAIAGDPRFVSARLHEAEANGHKFKVGQKVKLVGLEDFAEFNGKIVEIEAIRSDGPNGKSYYIKGKINKYLNWLYEYRLSEV